MKRFETTREESFRAKRHRFVFNLFPAIRGTGVWVSFISSDWREIHTRLPLSWRTKNYVGTVFGGSIYASTDPFYMLQFMKILGDKYIVWDKSAEVKFLRPIKDTVYARFLITEDHIEEVKEQVAKRKYTTMVMQAQLEDKEGTVYAEILKTIYIADKAHYKARRS